MVHSVLAQYSYFERYQAYLIAIGVYFAFSVAGEILPDRKKAVALLALAALVVAPVKWNLVVLTPRGAEDTYAQRYQAALFLKRYYQLRPIATGELGYISLIHDGPITDLLGLGDYEVLQRRKKLTDTPAFYADLARRRQFPVVVDYSGTLGPSANRTPATWFLVAEWRLQATAVSALPELFQFWATTGGAAVELKADLEQNAPRLPGGVTKSSTAASTQNSSAAVRVPARRRGGAHSDSRRTLRQDQSAQLTPRRREDAEHRLRGTESRATPSGRARGARSPRFRPTSPTLDDIPACLGCRS